MEVLDGLPDEQALFLTDILLIGWQAIDYCDLMGEEITAGEAPDAVVDCVGMGAAAGYAVCSARLARCGRR
ncbi:hypothetical protein [Lichenicola sp.]|uniref:hypothetical protein n=1 Tax=Lichenicola sp. TaxID=2804529 RepID=UPI003B009784